MTKYEQKPTGWWQDSKNRMQPPGSYLDPTLRLAGEPARTTARGRGRPPAARVRRFVDGVWPRRAQGTVPTAARTSDHG